MHFGDEAEDLVPHTLVQSILDKARSETNVKVTV